VKTAISVPDDTFERVSRRAEELHMSRSELFARAAEKYLDALDAQSLAKDVDRALADLGADDDASADAVAAGHRVLDAADDTW
jgi:metal-responsive CopG/Arc/MetJ family transcriptional regulator